MIHFICGKPRGGKSYWAVCEMIRWLRDTDLGICTNLSVKLPELNEYTQGKFGRSLDVVRRVHFLENKDLCDFWRWRYVGGRWVQAPPVGKDEETKWGDMQGGGVVYMLDEIHHVFGARQWAEHGRRCLWYHSQHGKLGDHVYLITQRANLVDRQLRDLAEDFMVLRNRSKERVGIFRSFPRITYGCYLRCPTGSSQDVQEYGGWTKLDLEVARCYDTAAGIGIQGTVADTQDKRKGVSLLWLIPGFILLVALLSFGPHWVIKGVAAYAAGPSEKTAAVAPSAPVPAPAPAKAVVQASAPIASPGAVIAAPTLPKVEGWALSGSRASVLISDGRIANIGPVAAGADYLIWVGRALRVGDVWAH